MWLILALALAAPSQVQIVAPEKERILRRAVPSTTDAEVNRIAQDQRTLYYTALEMPSAYQHEGMGSGRTSFKDARFEIGPTGILRTNANVEFPWVKPGGTDNCPNVTSFKFMHLPAGKPVVYFQKRLPEYESWNSIGKSPLGLAWCFPKGTVFGEVLMMRSPDGRDYAFELRIRRKDDGFWEVDIFRPYPTARDLLKALDSNDAVAIHLRSAPLYPGSLSDSNHTVLGTNFVKIDRSAFSVRSGVDRLPALSTVNPAKLLRVSFKSALGTAWRGNCFAPTTDAEFHIIPKGYQGTFLGTDSESCAKCHKSSMQDAGYFQSPRDWYGHVRGSDQILSWHPIEPSSLLHDAGDGPTVMRNEFLEAGLVVPYDQKKYGGYKLSQ